MNYPKGKPYDLEMSADEAVEQYNPPPQRTPGTCDSGPSTEAPPNWTAANSFVVSGPLGDLAEFPGHRFSQPAEAQSWAVAKYGWVYEFNTIPGRWFARVPKPKAA